jgi:hypothetical protein
MKKARENAGNKKAGRRFSAHLFFAQTMQHTNNDSLEVTTPYNAISKWQRKRGLDDKLVAVISNSIYAKPPLEISPNNNYLVIGMYKLLAEFIDNVTNLKNELFKTLSKITIKSVGPIEIEEFILQNPNVFGRNSSKKRKIDDVCMVKDNGNVGFWIVCSAFRLERNDVVCNTFHLIYDLGLKWEIKKHILAGNIKGGNECKLSLLPREILKYILSLCCTGSMELKSEYLI